MNSDSDQYKSTVDAIRIALNGKHVIWIETSCTLLDGKGGSSSLPCDDGFEGEIFQGELAGCKLKVDRLEARGKVAFMAQFIKDQGSTILDQQTGELMWQAASSAAS